MFLSLQGNLKQEMKKMQGTEQSLISRVTEMTDRKQRFQVRRTGPQLDQGFFFFFFRSDLTQKPNNVDTLYPSKSNVTVHLAVKC